MTSCPGCGKESAEGFRFCPYCGAPLAEASPVSVARERKVVSVLFCDLVGFTAASERADPEEVQARIAPYHQRVRRELEAFGGTVAKFIGDAVMAVFGVPVAHEDDPERAVRAGLAVLEAIGELNEADPGLALSVRVGVNTGEVVVSLDDRPERGEGMVLGDVVNTAARIQAAAPTDAVAVGEGTFRATERVFEYEPLSAVSAKGKAEPVPIWRPVAPRARFGSEVLRSLTRPLVGRELDLALLRGTFDKVASERSVQLVTLVGEPGVGKSRLVAELFAHADGLEQLVTWRRGRCLPYGEGITFWALGEIVKAHAGIYDSDSAAEARMKLEAVLPEGDERPWLRARLWPLLGIESSPAAQEEAFTAWRRFLESVAEAGPAVLVFEDVHWADDAMLAFLEHVADWAQGVPLLLICTARPELYETHPAWAAGLANQIAIRLSPLSDADTARLLSALLEKAVLPAETQQLLLERAGGNPLYAEEFVRMLSDRGLLDERGNLKAGAEIPFPESLQALIASRLDTLPPERKRLLQDAAVIGKVFWSGSLAVMGEREPHQVEQALHELVRKELVRQVRRSSMEGEAEYGFWHLLVRDVAYGQIPRAERAVKHVQAAGWLEAKAGKRIEDLAEVLAYHTGEALSLARASGDESLAAEVAPLASRYALLAGERALGLDTGKALTLLERARALTSESDSDYPLVLSRWADAARHAGRLREAADALEQAITIFQTRGDVLHAGEALATFSNVRSLLGEPGHLVLAEQAAKLLEQTPGPELVAAVAQLAGAQLVAGANGRAVATAGRALQLADQLGLPLPARALGFRGAARCSEGELLGLAEMEQALELLVAEGKGRDAAVLNGNLALMRWFFEGPAAALIDFEQAQAFAAARGLTEAGQWIAAVRAHVLVQLGRLDDALSQAETLAPALLESGDLLVLCELRACQALARAERGQDAVAEVDAALRMAQESEHPLRLAAAAAAVSALAAAGRRAHDRALLADVAAADGHENPEYAVWLPPLARAAAQVGDPDLVGRLADHVPDTLPLPRHVLATLGALQAEASGDETRAAGLYAEVAGRWEQFSNVLEQAHALLGQGRCLTALADPGADQPLRQARALFTDMRAKPRVTDCDTLIAQTAKLSS